MHIPPIATHCNALQRTATHCNTLQHTYLPPSCLYSHVFPTRPHTLAPSCMFPLHTYTNAFTRRTRQFPSILPLRTYLLLPPSHLTALLSVPSAYIFTRMCTQGKKITLNTISLHPPSMHVHPFPASTPYRPLVRSLCIIYARIYTKGNTTSLNIISLHPLSTHMPPSPAHTLHRPLVCSLCIFSYTHAHAGQHNLWQRQGGHHNVHWCQGPHRRKLYSQRQGLGHFMPQVHIVKSLLTCKCMVSHGCSTTI